MKPLPTLLMTSLVLLILSPNAAAYPYAGTSSTGDVDTWNLPQVPSCNPKQWQSCLQTTCMPYFGDRAAVLTLLDGHAVDRVELTVLRADAYYGAPTAVATASQPAIVHYRVNGCGVPLTSFVVSGLIVEGEVAYNLEIIHSDGLGPIGDICINC